MCGDAETRTHSINSAQSSHGTQESEQQVQCAVAAASARWGRHRGRKRLALPCLARALEFRAVVLHPSDRLRGKGARGSAFDAARDAVGARVAAAVARAATACTRRTGAASRRGAVLAACRRRVGAGGGDEVLGVAARARRRAVRRRWQRGGVVSAVVARRSGQGAGRGGRGGRGAGGGAGWGVARTMLASIPIMLGAVKWR